MPISVKHGTAFGRCNRGYLIKPSSFRKAERWRQLSKVVINLSVHFGFTSATRCVGLKSHHQKKFPQVFSSSVTEAFSQGLQLFNVCSHFPCLWFLSDWSTITMTVFQIDTLLFCPHVNTLLMACLLRRFLLNLPAMTDTVFPFSPTVFSTHS